VDAQLNAPGAPDSFTNAAARVALDTDIAALRKNYPDELRTAMTQFSWVDILKPRDPVRAEVILRDLASNKDPRVAGEAQRQLGSIQMQRKLAKEPLDLKFKAVDGTQVDLAKLRGKVVLVDFWAVWCGPCRMEIPNVVATYKQLHKDGFEIVGISLDQDKDKLVSFTNQAGMTWPQYFDGKMWSNEISSHFGISAIPAMWLVDKKGFVRSTEARGSELAERVKKLLAE
jgi:thiol-disulfide isomerase/thioredoxin